MRIMRKFGLLVLCIGVLLIPGTASAQQAGGTAPLVKREIRYHNAEAGAVALVWGLDSWQLAPEEIRPAGTTVLKSTSAVMQTPMTNEDGVFVIVVQAPAGSTIDYIFQISKTRSGVSIGAWDVGNTADRQYRTVADQDGVTTVESTAALAEQLYTSSLDTQLQVNSLLVLLVAVAVLAVVAVRVRAQNPYLDF